MSNLSHFLWAEPFRSVTDTRMHKQLIGQCLHLKGIGGIQIQVRKDDIGDVWALFGAESQVDKAVAALCKAGF